MILFFPDRTRRADHYPLLPWKVRIFSAGAVMAVAGIALEMDWLIWVALGVLAVGFLLRFVPGGRGVRLEEEDEEG